MPIFDQGYQHWKGALSGHAWRWLAITRQGLRTQLKGRYVRLVLILAWLPALALVAALAVWGLFEQGVLGSDLLSILRSQGITENPQVFRQAMWTVAYSFFFRIELGFIMLLVTITGRNLISLDLCHNALPLYLSRPLTRLDYFFGKLGVIAALTAAVAVLPAVAAYLLGVCFSLDLTVVRDTWWLLPASVLYGLVIVASVGTLMLAFSSMSRRSIYVGLAWVGLFLVSWAIRSALAESHAYNLRFARMRKQSEFEQKLVNQEAQRMFQRTRPLVRPQEEDDAGQTSDEKEFSGGPMPKSAPDFVNPLEARQAAQLKFQKELEAEDEEALRTDWRSLFSYTANLDRIGEAILQTDAAWVKIGHAYERQQSQLNSMSGMPQRRGQSRNSPPPPFRERSLAEIFVPQYPWTWSASVLAGLFGLSVCILSTRVKSLDRLK
jgi:ABC-2 type transport system permease protein